MKLIFIDPNAMREIQEMEKFVSKRIYSVFTSAVLWALLSFLIAGCSQVTEDLTPINSVQGKSYIVMGDTRGGIDIFSDIVYLIMMLDELPQATFILGDMISEPGNLFQWKVFSNILYPLSSARPFYPVAGNHDVDSWRTQQIYKEQLNLDKTYYSVDENGIFFIVLDSEEPGHTGRIEGAQLQFLIDELENRPEYIDYIMVFLHRPLFPAGSHGPLENNDQLHSLFATHNVDVVFAGHDHLYDNQNIDGVNYITTGGGGSPLYPEMESSFFHFIRFYLWESSIFFQVISPSGAVLDEFEIFKREEPIA